MQDFDFIVAGGGTSGCVVASRLVAAGKSVLLLEGGPGDRHPLVHIPAAIGKLLVSTRTTMYRAEPDAGVNGRTLIVPQGRVLGGGSSVNAMIYIRGQAQDYDGWRDLGCPGWGYRDLLPIFRRSERNERPSDDFHGDGGKLRVTDPTHRHPMSLAFVRAAQEAGYAQNPDFNGAVQAGVGFYQRTVFNGRRASAVVTYLDEVKSNPLLTLHTDCMVTGVVLKDGAATGVRYRMQDGSMHEAGARAEIILTAGAFGTPKLLMLSGIGPAAELARQDIPVLRDVPGVGNNYQDHISATVNGVTPRPISLLGHDKGLRALGHGVRYMLTRRGLLTTNIVESGGFFDTQGTGRPDVQMHVAPILMPDNQPDASSPSHGMSISPCVLRPTSRGKLSLRSKNPSDPLLFQANSLSTREDIDTLVRGIKVARRIMRQPALQALGIAEVAPSPQENTADEVLERHARQSAKTVYHPCGTCKMGDDAMAVVDDKLRVIGVPRLRIADASIMPRVISGNTNAACVVIAERCADFVLG